MPGSQDERSKRVQRAAVLALLLASILLTVPALPPSRAGPPSPPQSYAGHVPGEILVRFEPGARAADRANARALVAARPVRRFRSGAEHWKIGKGLGSKRAAERLSRHPLVRYAEPNYILHADRIPDDARYPELWGLNNDGQTGGLRGADISAEEAWDLSTGSRQVLVGVIDSGIDTQHADLALNIWTNPGEIAGNGIDDDGNGYIDDIHGWDFVNDDNDPFDDNGHGSHVAGTIGALGDNGFGVAGVAWQVTMIPLKFLDFSGSGPTSDAIRALEYATAAGAHVTNNSWGGGAFSQALLDAILDAGRAGSLFVASAGNGGVNTDSTPHYPSSYDADNIISVAATDHDDLLTPLSNFGALTVDLAAPGVAILSTLPGGGHEMKSGTSMAAPHVTGAAALVRSMVPGLPALTVKSLILDSTDPLPALDGLTLTGGRLNVFRALSQPETIPPGSIGDLVAEGPTSSTVTLRWTATGDDLDTGTASSYEIRISNATIDQASFDAATPVAGTPPPLPPGGEEIFEVTGLTSSTTWHFAVRALDEWGNAGPVSNSPFETTLPPPLFASSPASFSALLLTGEATTRSLTLQNAGVGTLDWRIPVQPARPWLTASPSQGRQGPGESVAVTVTLDASGLPGGTYTGSVDVETNDPAMPVAAHAVLLDVMDAPVMEVSPPVLDFGDVFAGFSSSLPVTLMNTGTLDLHVGRITSPDPDVTAVPSSLTLIPGESFDLSVLYAPSVPGSLGGALEIQSDAPLSPSVTLPLAGRAVTPPGIRVSPAFLDEILPSGRSGSRLLSVSNTGAGDLSVSLSTELVPGDPGPSTGSVAPEGSPVQLPDGGFESGTFQGWIATSNGLPELMPWTVLPAGGGFFANSSPREGRFSALNGFDGEAGLEYVLRREIPLPAGALLAELSYYDRIQFDGQGRPGSLPRIYEASLQDPAGIALDLFVHEEILLAGRGYTDLGWRRRSVDLSPYAGRTVHLVITQTIPEAFTGPAQIEFDEFRIEGEAIPQWLAVSPTAAVIPAGTARDFVVTFDAGPAVTTRFSGAVRIDSNDPAAPRVRVPATLAVIGTPEIVVVGAEVILESTLSYSDAAAQTSHGLALAIPPVGGGTVEVVVDGDYSAPSETASIQAEGLFLGTLGGVGADCVADTGTFPLSPSELATLAADGSVDLTVQNSPDVDTFCLVNQHTVRLRYRGPGDHLDFGPVLVGGSRAISVAVENHGTGRLVVSAITSDRPEFGVSPGSFTVEPGSSREVQVTFSPTAAALFSGALSIASNDPGDPLTTLPVEGAGLDPPVVGVDPPALLSALLTGEHETRALSLSNGGGSPMEFRLALRPLLASGAGPVPCTATSALVSDFADGRLLQVDLAGGGIATVASGLASPNKGLALDSTGIAWVTESQGGTIARVDPAAGTVERIGRSFQFPNGLALLGDGPTAYLTQTGTGLLSQVDLDSGSATTLATGLDLPNGVAFDPGRALVYVAEYGGGEVSSVDPSTGTMVTVATGLGGPAALALDPTGSRLYVAEARTNSISLVDPATGATSPVATLPETPGSLALDPDGTSLWVTGSGGGTVLRVDLATGSAAPVAGGMAAPLGIALQSPPGCRERFVHVTPASGTVPPFGVAILDVTIDPGRLPTGDYPAEIDVVTNDPATPLVTVPVALHLTGIPKLTIEPIPAVVESVRGYFSPGAATHHDLALAPPLPGTAVIELEIEGDYGEWGELATLSAEGIVLGSVGELDSDCSSDKVGFPVSAAELALLAADGVISAAVQNTQDVDAACPVNRHTVRLRYSLPVDPLEFGPVFVGFPRERSFLTRNDGTENLEIDSLHTDRAEFTVTPTGFTLAPRETREVAVRFAPLGAGPAAGALGLASNDPGRPSALMALDGEGVVPPAIAFQPDSISASLDTGELETRILTLSNSGGSDLVFSLTEGSGGLFQPLAASPLPLTCVVGDPASGILYAQVNEGTAFYRYVGSLDGWESLSPAPLSSGNNGGAALLNGRIYTAYTLNQSEIGVYEIGTDSWSTLPHPMGIATGNIAGDGVRYLYLIHGERLVRFDPAAGAVTVLADPPFFFQAWGGLRHYDGVLYAHRGNGLAEFAAYEIASDSWRVLPTLPSGAVLGAAIDPVRRTYLAYGSYGANDLYEYSIDRNQWTVRTIPLFSVNDGGLAWLDEPVQGITMVEGEGGTGVARLLTAPSFLILEPPSGTVPAGGSLDVDVTLDTSALLAGVHRSAVKIVSNDPASPSNQVPVTLDLSGAPDIAVTAATFSLPSTRSYSSAGPTTTHELILPEPPAAGATLQVTVDGDYGESAETATVMAEGRVIGTVGSTGADCTSTSATFPLGDALVADLAADGVVWIEIDAEDRVGSFCATNLHAVDLAYTQPVDPVAFGQVFLGYERTRSFALENRGTDDLHVSSITSSLSEVTVTAGPPILPPGGSRVVSTTFRPARAGPLSAALTVHSDDPDTPAMTVPLSGTGLVAPVVGVQPASMTHVLFSGARETHSLTLANGGGSDLLWSVSLEPGSPPFLSVQPSSGAIPAGASFTVEVTLDTFGLTAGSASGRIDVITNDPATPVVPVPVSLTVIAAPDIEVAGKADLSSTKVFSGTGALTQHELIPPRPPTGRGTFQLVAEGDFGDPVETATLSLEGIPVGGLGGVGVDCFATTATFSVDPLLLASSAADGVIRATVQNSQGVNDFCPVNRHDLSLSYPFAIDPVEFGVTLVGASRTLEAIVTNRGIEDLVIGSVAADPSEFSASWSAATLAPGQEVHLWLSFAPAVPGPASGLLTFSSNDPDETVVAITLTGTGVEPPVVEVQPPSLTSVVDPGGTDSQALTILNRGGSDLIFTSSAGAATFMTVSPGGGTVPPGGSRDVLVTLSSAGLDLGVHQGALSVASNDPVDPLVAVPVLFLVRGTPGMKVITDPQETVLSSSKSFTSQGAWTLHRLQPAPAPTGRGILTVTVEGDFGGSFRSATVTSEGAYMGTVGPSGFGCTRVSRSFVVSLGLLRFLAGDGIVAVRLLNSSQVRPSCPVNSHSVELRYSTADPGRLDFEETFVGGNRSRTVTIESIGTDILDVSLTSPAPEFSTSPSTLSLFPGSSSDVAVTFAPVSVTTVSDVLSIHSNDPGDPVHTLALTGTGVPAPVAVVAEDSFEIAVPPGGAATRRVHLSNEGKSDLIWEIGAESPGVPGTKTGWLSFSPAAGVVAPGGEAELHLTVDAASTPDGDHTAVVTILNNDPLNGRIEIPVLLHAGETHVDQILVEPGTLNLSSRGKTVRVWLQLPAAFDPREILIPTVSLNGRIPPEAHPIDFVDENHDGLEGVVFKFDRSAVEAILPEGDSIPVTVTGEVRNRTWFTGTAAIRVIRSQAVDP